MEPDEVISHLRAIATAIDEAPEPSRVLVARALLRLLLATDRTLSLSIRDAVRDQILQLVPGEFGGEYYDTNPQGKGFKKGYVSFGLDPNTWDSTGLIGGILFKLNYDPQQFSSEAPEPTAPGAAGFQHSKGSGSLISLTLECGYYNKMIDGSYSHGRPLGAVDVILDEKENIQDIEVKNPTELSEGIKELIQEISSDPPEHAQSAGLKKKHNVPTGSPKSLLKYLIQNQRSDVGQSEINGLARAMTDRTGRPHQNVLDEVTKFFRDRGWAINPNA